MMGRVAFLSTVAAAAIRLVSSYARLSNQLGDQEEHATCYEYDHK